MPDNSQYRIESAAERSRDLCGDHAEDPADGKGNGLYPERSGFCHALQQEQINFHHSRGCGQSPQFHAYRENGLHIKGRGVRYHHPQHAGKRIQKIQDGKSLRFLIRGWNPVFSKYR